MRGLIAVDIHLKTAPYIFYFHLCTHFLPKKLSGTNILYFIISPCTFFRYKASWCRQFRSVFWRSWLTNKRDVLIFRIRFFQSIVSVQVPRRSLNLVKQGSTSLSKRSWSENDVSLCPMIYQTELKFAIFATARTIALQCIR